MNDTHDDAEPTTVDPLRLLADEADRLRPIAESVEVEELRAKGEALQAEAQAKHAAVSNSSGDHGLIEAGELLNRASNLESERRQARQRLAEVEGLLSAGRDCDDARMILRAAQTKARDATAKAERIRSVCAEIEDELSAMHSARAEQLSRASQMAVSARLEGRPRPETPIDRDAERRAALAAEREQAHRAYTNAAAAQAQAETEIGVARSNYLEARHRRAKADYTAALAIVAPYIAEYIAAAQMAGFGRPRIELRPDDAEVREAEDLIEREIGGE